MSTIRKYIIVDDDPINNVICRMLIQRVINEAEITTFEIPEEGLAFIEHKYTNILMPTILFLDINMPTLTAWEFMDQYEKFNENVKRQISIYIVSSSVDQRDIDKADDNQYVKGLVSKPLNRESILFLASA